MTEPGGEPRSPSAWRGAFTRKVPGSLRSRMLVSMMLIAMGTLGITWLGTYILVGHEATSAAATSILTDAREVATIAPHVRPSDTRKLLLAAGFSGGNVVTITPSGQVAPPLTALPAGISASQLNMHDLLRGYATAGASGHLAYAAVPLYLSTRINTVLHVATNELVVMVVTRRVRPPSTGLGYFILIGLASLIVASLVAWILSRRLTGSISRVVSTTSRLASGELEARVESSHGDYQEITSLADAINDMAAQLETSRQSERQFLLSVSHDLRTPLTSIRGYAEAILDGATDDVDHAVKIIRNESYRLDRLIRDLLDLAYLQAKRFSLDMQPVEVARIAAQVANNFQPAADSQGITLEVVEAVKAADQPAATVNGDESRLVQSVGNVVENALKYASNRIEIRHGMNDGMAVISVTDDGPGIAPQDLPHIFERHYRADRTHGARNGTGLGLAIVSELVSTMGGTVSAYSAESGVEGASIVITLPLLAQG
ncbi:MAG: sensor histidine kinase [Acidimicrobiales bacterium]